VNKPSPPTESRRLDAQAIQTLRQLASEFAFFNSAATAKREAQEGQSGGAPILTSMLANAVDQPSVDVLALADKPRQRADAFAAHLI
jgi:hypothetical protein